ncbi:hypothetical protein BpHYR1_007404 [Brachionus plicatilis]|uniref:Uncharacterized protein n=1 Tax=Brachionus plicatilis TaxID=10195 RepID=A0A3M7PL10_BRAPC|nr:hypothetical protein BpHYR1_007404 [Brachionus plicatilis]
MHAIQNILQRDLIKYHSKIHNLIKLITTLIFCSNVLNCLPNDQSFLEKMMPIDEMERNAPN